VEQLILAPAVDGGRKLSGGNLVRMEFRSFPVMLPGRAEQNQSYPLASNNQWDHCQRWPIRISLDRA